MKFKHLTSTGKFVLIYIILAILCSLGMKLAHAAEVNVHLEWTYNGIDIEGRTLAGFRMYQESPSGVVSAVAEIPEPTLRVWDGNIQVEEGRSMYSLVAYIEEDGTESPHSEKVPFEYMESSTPGLPAPTVIIRFN